MEPLAITPRRANERKSNILFFYPIGFIANDTYRYEEASDTPLK